MNEGREGQQEQEPEQQEQQPTFVVRGADLPYEGGEIDNDRKKAPAAAEDNAAATAEAPEPAWQWLRRNRPARTAFQVAASQNALAMLRTTPRQPTLDPRLPKSYGEVLSEWVALDLQSFRTADQRQWVHKVKISYHKRLSVIQELELRKPNCQLLVDAPNLPTREARMTWTADFLKRARAAEGLTLSQHMLHMRRRNPNVKKRKRAPTPADDDDDNDEGYEL